MELGQRQELKLAKYDLKFDFQMNMYFNMIEQKVSST